MCRPAQFVACGSSLLCFPLTPWHPHSNAPRGQRTTTSGGVEPPPAIGTAAPALEHVLPCAPALRFCAAPLRPHPCLQVPLPQRITLPQPQPHAQPEPQPQQERRGEGGRQGEGRGVRVAVAGQGQQGRSRAARGVGGRQRLPTWAATAGVRQFGGLRVVAAGAQAGCLMTSSCCCFFHDAPALGRSDRRSWALQEGLSAGLMQCRFTLTIRPAPTMTIRTMFARCREVERGAAAPVAGGWPWRCRALPIL